MILHGSQNTTPTSPIPLPDRVPPKSTAPAGLDGLFRVFRSAQNPVLAARILTPKLQSCAKCRLAHTVAYGNKLNTGNAFHVASRTTALSIAQSAPLTSHVNW